VRETIDARRLAVMAQLDQAFGLFIVLMLMARSSRAMTKGAAVNQRQR